MDRKELAEFCGSLDKYELVLDIILNYEPLYGIRDKLLRYGKELEKALELYADEGLVINASGKYHLNYAIIGNEGETWYSFYVSRCMSARRIIDKYETLYSILENEFDEDVINCWIHNREDE